MGMSLSEDAGGVFFLVEEGVVSLVSVRVVTSHTIGRYLLVCVAETDVTHVISIVHEIGVESVVVPEVMLVVLSFPMSFNHVV